MISRILLAVDDTPESLAAARVAIEIARGRPTELRVVHVSADHLLDAAIQTASGAPAVAARRASADTAILRRVAALGTAAGVPTETTLLSGDTVPAVLQLVRSWSADLVVVGKSERSANHEPYVGPNARQLLEFCEVPVVVVAAQPAGHAALPPPAFGDQQG